MRKRIRRSAAAAGVAVALVGVSGCEGGGHSAANANASGPSAPAFLHQSGPVQPQQLNALHGLADRSCSPEHLRAFVVIPHPRSLRIAVTNLGKACALGSRLSISFLAPNGQRLGAAAAGSTGAPILVLPARARRPIVWLRLAGGPSCQGRIAGVRVEARGQTQQAQVPHRTTIEWCGRAAAHILYRNTDPQPR